ncbi:hypothetical protein ABZ545_27695 [Streptomyces abikoensis]|uniref:DUF7848 domain-containing protein n=1 Tax=Streptomyces abikoensis TaxID=97398 RepID=A0ABW7T0X2_9ACTN
MSEQAAEWVLHPMDPPQNPPFHLAECRACMDSSKPEPDASDADLWAIGHAQATDHQDFRFAAIHYARASPVRRPLPDQAEDVD